MIDPVGMKSLYSQIASTQRAGSAEARTEFLTIFYKELLKQVIKAPDFSLDDEDKKDNLISSYNSDVMVEQLARELAKNAATRPNWYSAGEMGR